MTGDTWHFTAWDNAGGGDFNSGHVYGTFNDGTMPAGANSANVAFLELTAYDPANVNNTNISLVNALTSLGAAQTTVGYCASGWTWKSDDPFVLNNNIYLLVHCMQNMAPFVRSSSTLIMSPDHGAHWCNVSHYLTGGTGGVKTCDSGNWSATGDVPTVVGDMLWPGASKTDTTNPMAQGAFVQVCQNQSVNCPSALTGSVCDPATFVCFNGNSGDYNNMYSARVAGDPMVLANWQYWNGTIYQSSIGSAASVATMLHGHGTTPSIVYLPDFSLYLMQTDAGTASPTSQIRFVTAPNPYGPWTDIGTAPFDQQSNFPTEMLSRLVHVGTGHYTITDAVGGIYLDQSIYHPYFQEWDLKNLNIAK